MNTAAETPVDGEPMRAVNRTLVRLSRDRSLASAGAPVAIQIRSVSSRPFSCVARLDVTSPAGARPVTAKIPRRIAHKADGRVAQLGKELTAATFLASVLRGEPELGVPGVVAFYPDVPALVWDTVAGETLSRIIEQSAAGFPRERRLRALEDACRGAGRWLRALQAATPVVEARLSLPAMAEYVDVRLQQIEKRSPGALGSGLSASVRRAFSETTLSAADRRMAAVHGDFSLSNIMSDGHHTIALDFSRFGIGSIYYDVTRLYHQMGLLAYKPWFRPGTIVRLRRALLSGFDPGLRADRRAFQLFLVQHVLSHWLGRLKAAPSRPLRGTAWWVGYCHRRELETLVAGLQRMGRAD